MHIFTIITLAFSLAFSTPAWSQDGTPDAAPPFVETVDDQVFSAPVIIDGEELFVVRGSSALPASERASRHGFG